MGYPCEDSKVGEIAKKYATEHGVTFKEACDRLGLITLEDQYTIIRYLCPRCKAYSGRAVEAQRQSYVYGDGEFKCPKCGYTGYSDDFERTERNG